MIFTCHISPLFILCIGCLQMIRGIAGCIFSGYCYAANKYRYLDMKYRNTGFQRLDKSLVEECLEGIDTKPEIRIDG